MRDLVDIRIAAHEQLDRVEISEIVLDELPTDFGQ